MLSAALIHLIPSALALFLREISSFVRNGILKCSIPLIRIRYTKAIIAVDLAGIPCDYSKLFPMVLRKSHLFRPNSGLQKALGRVAILADTEVLRNAPMEMLQAGYGDIIGKFSALNDWKLSHLINGEYF